jgi:hypothetical protein
MYLILGMSVWFLVAGCRPETEEPALSDVSTQIIAVAAYYEPQYDNDKHIVFTGNDILWFNETTRELRFRQNYSNKAIVTENREFGIQFFIGDEFVLFTPVCMDVLSYRIFDQPVFYYDVINNKYFIPDGFPDVSLLPDPAQHQWVRSENRKAVEQEWARLMEQLKKENLYRTN